MKVDPQEAEQVVEALRYLRERDDVSRWKSGDLALAYLSRFEYGRRMIELAWLAAHSGYTRDGLRERVECSAFWEKGSRRWNNSVTWSHYNRARRGFDFEEACDLLERAEAETWSVAEFEMRCQEIKRGRNGSESAGPSNGSENNNPVTGKKRLVELPVWNLNDRTISELIERHGGHISIVVLPGNDWEDGQSVEVML